MKVLVYGSLNYDYVYKVDHILAPGETEVSEEREIYLGGKGLNQATAIAKAGIPVFLAGCVGNDGNQFFESCNQLGIDTTYIDKVDSPSGHAIIQKDKRGQNSILVDSGANRKQRREHIDKVLGRFQKDDILILQNEISMLEYIVDVAHKKEMNIILNPSPFDQNLSAFDFSKIDIFMINEIEGEQITGEKAVEDILKVLKTKYQDSKVMLTLGGEGAIYQDKDVQIRQSAYQVNVVDTTAAGDTFAGYFIASMIENMTLEEGLSYAARAAAIAVSRNGATQSIPMKNEVISAM